MLGHVTSLIRLVARASGQPLTRSRVLHAGSVIRDDQHIGQRHSSEHFHFPSNQIFGPLTGLLYYLTAFQVSLEPLRINLQLR